MTSNAPVISLDWRQRPITKTRLCDHSLRSLSSTSLAPRSGTVSALKFRFRSTVRGEIHDSDGLPVSNAVVVAVGLYPQSSPPHDSLGSLSTVTSSDGSFKLPIDRSDPAFLQQEAFLLGVSSDGKRTHIQLVPHVRCLADAGLDITLASQQPAAIRIVDIEGAPVADAEVSLARLSDQVIPHGIDWLGDGGSTHRTDSNGTASLPGIADSMLTMVYVEGSDIGQQCLRVIRGEDGQLQAVVMPTKLEAGALELVGLDPDIEVDLSALNMIFVAREIDDPDSQFTWCQTHVAMDGAFNGCRLSAGTTEPRGVFPDDFAYAFDRSDVMRFERAASGRALQLKLHPAVQVLGRLTNAESSEPVANVSIQHHSTDGRLTSTGRDGRFRFWAGPGRVGYLPYDAWRQFTLRDGSFLYPQSQPDDGILQSGDVSLQPCSRPGALAVDEDGNTIASARVVCEYKPNGNFIYRTEFFSDSAGRVNLDGVPGGVEVTLTASTDELRTAQPLTVPANAAAEIDLVLQPRHSVRLSGNVVDESGRPISGALVRVRRANVLSEELFQGVSRQAESVFGPNVLVETDSAGQFVSPPTLEWNQSFSVEIRSPGYRTARNYWTDATDAGEAERDLDFGTLTLRSVSEARSRKLTVFDNQTGEPIAGARLAFLGALTGLTRGVTDHEGNCVLALREGRQVFCVWKEGYTPLLRSADPGRLDGTVRLGRDTTEHTGYPHTQVDRKDAARRLIKLVQQPSKDDTSNRQRQYFYGLCLAEFDQAVETLETHPMRMYLSRELIRRPWFTPKQRNDLKRVVDHESGFHLLLMQLRRVESDEMRSKLVDEAIAFRGGARLLYGAQAADAILAAGETEKAMALLQDIWNAHPQLSDAVAAGERV